MSDYPAVATIIFRDGERSVERFTDETSLAEAVNEWFSVYGTTPNPTDTIVVLRGDYGNAGKGAPLGAVCLCMTCTIRRRSPIA